MSSTRDPEPPVLRVEGLRTVFRAAAGETVAVAGVDLTIRRGEIVGLVGESGSGKSVTGLSIMRLVDPPGVVSARAIRLGSDDLLTLPEPEMRSLRGRRLAMVFQDPLMTLNPVLRIGTQMQEAVTAHEAVGNDEARRRCISALQRVGIAEPEQRLRAWPHEFSGGMRQRVAIAIALLHQPELIICDEPTTALDVTIQAQILYEAERLCRESGTALLWVTHDLGVVARLADRICVMYAGRIVEEGPVGAVLAAPRHPYTAGLLASIPGRHARGTRLFQMPGAAGVSAGTAGCAFRPRCSRASAACESLPPLADGGDGRRVRCFNPL
jgi:peptide/nickel transport system ATP-binding protein